MTYIGKRAFLSVGRRGNQIGMPSGPPAGAIYDFASGSLPPGVTFTRASAAWGFNSSGGLTSYATDAPRFVYDPITLASLGLLVEGARTNSLRNSTMVGAVAGTPGTLPTNWTRSGTFTGLTQTVVGTGVEDGIEYIDVQFVGTPSTTTFFVLLPDAVNQIAAATGQVWTASCFLKVAAGSLTNVPVSFRIGEYDSGATLVGSGTSSSFPVTGAALRTQRFTFTRTLSIATTAFTVFGVRLDTTASAAIDLTLRIGLPQLELGAGASSPIKTSTVAVTRARDDAFITDARALTDAAIIVKARAPSYTDAVNAMIVVQRDDGTSANFVQMRRTASSVMSFNATTASVSQMAIVTAAVADNADFAIAGRIATNNAAVSLNGGAVLPDITVTVPAVTIFRIGATTSLAQVWNSTIRSIETRATASDAELVTLSTV